MPSIGKWSSSLRKMMFAHVFIKFRNPSLQGLLSPLCPCLINVVFLVNQNVTINRSKTITIFFGGTTVRPK